MELNTGREGLEDGGVLEDGKEREAISDLDERETGRSWKLRLLFRSQILQNSHRRSFRSWCAACVADRSRDQVYNQQKKSDVPMHVMD